MVRNGTIPPQLLERAQAHTCTQAKATLVQLEGLPVPDAQTKRGRENNQYSRMNLS